MGLISCRNLLIYFDAAAQRRTLSTLHFSMNDGGYMILGKSESVGESSQLYSPVSTQYRVFMKKRFSGPQKLSQILPTFPKRTLHKKAVNPARRKETSIDSYGLDKLIDSVLLTNYMPACAIINKDMDILKFRGNTSIYLAHSSGNANLNILRMTKPEFAIELRRAIQNALKTKMVARCTDVDIKIDSEPRTMSLDAWPLKIELGEPLLLIVFKLQDQGSGHTEQGADKKRAPETVSIKILKEKLNTTRDEMRALIVAHETAYRELQAANEEIVSTSEEFQTLNEELETSKEEIEAANEELLSTNQELLMRNDLLSESYKYSEAIIATVHEPMLVLDSTLHVKSANNSFYKKFRVNKDQTVGHSVFELGNRQWNIPKLRKLLLEIISQDISFKNLEITHTFPGIGERIMQLNAHRIIQKTHKEQLLLLAIEDITERTQHFQQEKTKLRREIIGHTADKLKLEKAVKERTKELEQKNRELEATNKDLTSFTYVSSHDLQEPLRKIRNFVSVLLDEENSRLSGDGKKYLASTYNTARRMQALIEDLLIYSRAKNTERIFENVQLESIVDGVKNDLEELIKDKKVTIKSDHLGDVNVIPFQFTQLFQNLISNSIKYAKPDVRPRIIIKSEVLAGNKMKKVGLPIESDYRHISVTDNGIGFDSQYGEQIFEVFQRLHSPDKFAGTGMGLAICKRIVENHSGIITATGELGKGSRFDIYIPVNRSAIADLNQEN